MKAAEICPIARDALETLLTERKAEGADANTNGRRKVARWPFPGTVELWIPDAGGVDQHTLATSLDVSLHGVGIRCDEPLAPGLELAIAIHEPELSLHGKAVVRHCTEIEEDYVIGLEFIFDD